MTRKFLSVVLAVATAFTIQPALLAQDGSQPSDQSQQYPPPQQYPGAQQYPPPQQYPEAQQYPQAQQYPPPQQYPGTQQYPQTQQYPDQAPAQSDQAADQQHAVARISIVQGDVNVKRGDSGDLVAAAVNAPLLAQDHLQTSDGSRAEVELDYANLIRLGPNTDVGFADLEYHRYQVQLGAGTIVYRVLRDSQAQAEIDTPSIALSPTQKGEYRISVLDDGTTQITVRSGEVEVYSPKGSQRLGAGQTMLVRGDQSDPEFQMTNEIAKDQFDDWCENRDREKLASRSYQYVSRDIYGADDLDQYGNWVPSQYGNVWQPQAAGPDWAPYSNGEWAWNGYYGWTWVDSAPWGWAPYHYGRWFWNTGYGWCWWPGSIFSSYLWSPALVGFFGWGGFGAAWSGLGWVALAPFELFHPWWGHGFFGHGGWGYGNRFGNYGIQRNANIAGMYRNAAIRGAAMTSQFNRFGMGGQRFGRATTAQLRNASLFRGGLPATPTRASLQFSNRQATPNPRLASVANRQFFEHQHPSQTTRGSLAQQQMHTQQSLRASSSGGFRPGASSAPERQGQSGFNGAQRTTGPSMERLSPPQDARTQTNASRPATTNGARQNAPQQSLHGVPPNLRPGTPGSNGYGNASRSSSPGGWQRFGDPGASMNSRTRTRAPEQSGWHRFGEPQHATTSPSGAGRSSAVQPPSNYGRSFGAGNYGGSNYQSRPLGTNQPRPLGMNQPMVRQRQSMPGGAFGYSARPNYASPAMPRSGPSSMPHYAGPSMSHSAPAAPHYSAPSMPHNSAPHVSAPHGGGGGSFHGGGAPHGSGGSHGGGSHGGGGHSSSGGGHHGR